MNNLPEWANWVARDEDGELYVFAEKPYKTKTVWWADKNMVDYLCVEETDDRYKHIKWEDEQPTNIKELAKEMLEEVESLNELIEALNRNWEAGHGEPLIAEYNAWEITQAKAHGYDEPPVMDMINHPNHYKGKHGLESIDIIEAFELNFHLGNVIKYVLRSGKKGNKASDLKKAIWYLERELEREDNE